MIFNDRIKNMQDDMVTSLQEIIRFKSVEGKKDGDMPFGKEVHDCLIYTLNLADKLGFKTKNVDNYAGYAEIGQGDDLIGILVHLDVVPEGDGWDYDPYGGEIADGKIFGRGTLDDKGPAIATLYAMKALLDEGVTLNKRVRIIFGLNEETGWAGINYYLEHEETPSLAFTPDAEFPACHGEKGITVFELKKDFKELLNDGGVEVLSITGGNAANMVPDYAEAKIIETYDIEPMINAYMKDKGGNLKLDRKDGVTTIQSTGISAHGSTPEVGENAISYLLDFVNNLDVKLGDSSSFIRGYERTIGLDYNGQRAGCGFEDEDSGKLTFNVGKIEMDKDSVKLLVNVRYPITTPLKVVEDGIKRTFKDIGMSYNLLDHMAPIYFPKDHELIVKLMKVYQEHTGDMSEPITMGGGTYARAMKNAVAFGGVFPGEPELAHQKNEYITIDNLVKQSQIYASALYELAK
ncbi:dipeptidase PepV [Acidaminobacter sp. JC074]|uniref:dipeptidase PepV n=1 Tax=Acidaminobacter sp. JC074 TaxID=2530199 RepID=UPI001F0F1B9F|nr:dipeptidase PepV [Acidaminobacter sp. JC074]MCH4887178.1 dipeptidase PepV [Acidaminobacter sp. JC074]